jgi:hypothetical protein
LSTHTIKTRSFVFHVALIALYVLPAVAVAAVPSAADLLRYNSNRPSKPRSVVVTFESVTFQPRELRIGAERFEVSPLDKVRLNVTVGAKVQVYGSMNSQLNGTSLTTVSATSPLCEVVIH